jgi:hypothetical protein
MAAARVDKAILQKLLAPEQRSWGIKYCSADPKGWDTFLAVAAKDRVEQAEKQELEICSRMGVTPEQFKAAKQKRSQSQPE